MDKGTEEFPGGFRQFHIAKQKAGSWECPGMRLRGYVEVNHDGSQMPCGGPGAIEGFNLWLYRVRFDITDSCMKDGFQRYTAKRPEVS